MPVYELAFASDAPPAPQDERDTSALRASLLLENVRWFCRIRFIVVAFFAAFAVMGALPGLLERFGVRGARVWPIITSVVLALENMVFLIHAQRLVDRHDSRGARANLWGQIVFDLFVVTVVVHFLGSLETYAPFAYLFHIVLACVFFPRFESLVVAVLSGVLYAGCVGLESTGVIPTAGIYTTGRVREAIDSVHGLPALHVAWAGGIWIIVWYLTSKLAAQVRQRDNELAMTNRRLVAAAAERSRHMLATTHQLKAPFAAIHANAHLLLRGYCGQFTDEARDILDRIASRCKRLAAEIQEMLQLANLGSTAQEPPTPQTLDVAGAVEWSIAQMEPVARARRITMETDIGPAPTTGVEDHLKMLILNLVSNAVRYSRDDGHVRITCRAVEGNGPVVTVTDRGIGIAAEKLPRIFDEHYRTKEALKHSSESSGLGLAIVRHVAELHRIRVRVESRLGEGTMFEVRFPSATEVAGPSQIEEVRHGLRDDR